MWIIAILPSGFFFAFAWNCWCIFTILPLLAFIHFLLAYVFFSLSQLARFLRASALSPCAFGNLFLVAWCNFCCYWRRLFTDSPDSEYRSCVFVSLNDHASRHKCRIQNVVSIVGDLWFLWLDYCGRCVSLPPSLSLCTYVSECFLCTCTLYKLCLDK